LNHLDGVMKEKKDIGKRICRRMEDFVSRVQSMNVGANEWHVDAESALKI